MSTELLALYPVHCWPEQPESSAFPTLQGLILLKSLLTRFCFALSEPWSDHSERYDAAVPVAHVLAGEELGLHAPVGYVYGKVLMALVPQGLLSNSTFSTDRSKS